MNARPSKSSVNGRLGSALRDGRSLTEDLDALWALVEAESLDAIRRIQSVFDELGYYPKPSGRPKTLEVAAAKLRRSPTLQLLNMDDLAGVRALVDDRFEQDALVEHLSSALGITDPRCRVDRRADPRSGYRAVHLLDRSGFVRCEIQVRTRMQHRWAMAFENLAEAGGREMRYGHQTAPEGSVVAQLVTVLEKLSSVIDVHERTRETTRVYEALQSPELRPRLLSPPPSDAGRAEYLESLSLGRSGLEGLDSALGSVESSIAALTRLKEDGADVLRLGL